MRKLLTAILIISLMIFALASCSFIGAMANGPFTVSLNAGEHFTVVGTASFSVEKGGSATFTVQVDEGYVLTSTDADVVITDTTVTVSNVQANKALTLIAAEAYTVTLAESECYKITSSATAKVAKGGTATFTVRANEGYILSSSDPSVTVSGGVVTVTNVQADRTVTVDGTKNFTVSVNANNPSWGNATASLTGNVEAGTAVTATASANDGYRFLCWTLEKPLLNGAAVFSTEENINFTADSAHRLFANFISDGKAVVVYELNGGNMTINKNDLRFAEEVNIDFTNCVNLAGNIGNFEYDEHNFLEYNTEADGSGMRMCAGGVMKLPENGLLTVYAQWQKWSDPRDFVTELGANELSIKGYNGNDEFLSIPSKIDGKPVTSISKLGICQTNEDTIKAVVIPRSITTIEDNAFYYCQKLDTVYMNDNVTSVTDKAFGYCKKFSNLILNAATPPHHVSGAVIATRLKVILANQDLNKPIMMLVAGSSTWYGYDSAYLEELLDNKYLVINCGTNANCCGFLYMEGLSPYLREGDIILNSPEYGHNQYAGFEITERTLLYAETCYNVFMNVDFSKYYGFFDALGKFNTDDPNDASDLYRFSSRDREYDEPNNALTYPNCDNASVREYPNQLFNPMSSAIHAGVLTDERVERFNWIYNFMKDKGITYYLGCAPIYGYAPPGEGNLTAYYNACVEKLDCTIISNPNDHIYNVELYYDQEYHHTNEGAHERAGRVAIDLRKILGLDEE